MTEALFSFSGLPSVVAHETDCGVSVRSRPRTLNTAVTHLITLLHAQFAPIVLQLKSTCQDSSRMCVFTAVRKGISLRKPHFLSVILLNTQANKLFVLITL